MKKSKMVSVRLTTTQLGLIQKLAEEYDQNCSQVIRNFINYSLQNECRRLGIPYRTFPQKVVM